MEGYILDLMNLSENFQRKKHKSNLVNEISGAPEMMHFESPDRTSISYRGDRRSSRKGNNRTKSWDSEDVDFSPSRLREEDENSAERSLTPEPHVEGLYAAPQNIKKRKRRYTILNVIDKVRSPHFNRKKRYKVPSSSDGGSPSNLVSDGSERGGSPLDEVREDGGESTKELKGEEEEEKVFDVKMTNNVLPMESEEGIIENLTAEDEGVMEKKADVNERESDKIDERATSEEVILSSSEHSSLDAGVLAVRKRAIEELKAQSPTRGIPKLYTLKRSVSFSDVDISSGTREKDILDVSDIDFAENKHDILRSPEPIGIQRKSTIDWEKVEEGVAILDETPPTGSCGDSRPSTSTPELPMSPISKLDGDGSHDRLAELCTSPNRKNSQVNIFEYPSFFLLLIFFTFIVWGSKFYRF